jgi:hypothetical protein
MRALPRFLTLRSSGSRAVVAGALVTFSLAALLLSTDVPARISSAFARMGQMVEGEVVVLFVPLCALVFALAVEVVRMTGGGHLPEPRPATRLPRGWHEGSPRQG